MERISLKLLVLVQFLHLDSIQGSTECVWATGIVECRRNQSRVEGSVVEVYDLDSPEAVSSYFVVYKLQSALTNPLDPDDKVGFSFVDNPQGLWNVEGCAADQDWLPGLANRPEFYIRVFHKCNKPQGEFKKVFPVFRIFSPETYDHHIQHPIVLDNDYDPGEEELSVDLDMHSI